MLAKSRVLAIATVFFLTACVHKEPPPVDHNSAFEALAKNVVERVPALSPISATSMGDHRFDSMVDDVSAASRKAAQTFYQNTLDQLDTIEPKALKRENRIDEALLRHELEGRLWTLQTLREWSWNPLIYTGLAGSSIYSLMARDFAPLNERLLNAASRLEQLPRFYGQVRATLVIEQVPLVHAETAVKQNLGVTSIIDALIKPQLATLSDADQARMNRAIENAVAAVNEQQTWLEQTLLPNASGEFRLGAEKFDKKLSFTLFSPLSRQEIRQRAESQIDSVRAQMYQVAKPLVDPAAPDNPTPEQQQSIIEAGLELAYAQIPGRNDIVDVANQSLVQATEFVIAKDLVEVPKDPVEIIIMPKFQRGIALAYCDPPGPLDRGQKTFYAVAPLPEEWTDEQVNSFLREYNFLSIQNLTIHEAMPGHYLQLALSNRHPSVLRAILASGPFIEGWAVYAEGVMVDAGYLDNDPLMRLIKQKWYLRAVANSIIDQAIHVDGMTRDEAMTLMTYSTFQEEREAAGKWVRAQLSSTQLSTYFVGYQEHADLRREMEQRWGSAFTQRRYHDAVLSYGSPPVQFVRAQLLNLPL